MSKRRILNYRSDIDMDAFEDDDDDDCIYKCNTIAISDESSSDSDSADKDDDDDDDGEESETGSDNESESGSFSADDDEEEEIPGDGVFQDGFENELDLTNSSNEEKSAKSSNDHQTECPICLAEFKGQVVGNPENCKHFFCVVCIKEWAKTVNSCPIDRLTFNIINVRPSVTGTLLEEFYVDDVNPNGEDEFFEDPTFCQVCDMCDREDRLLLCDECDNGYHLECLNPPLDHVPIEDWYCPVCSLNRSTNPQAQEPIPVLETPARGRIRGARTAGGAARVARARRALIAARNLGPDQVTLAAYRLRSSSSRGRRKRRRKSTARKAKSRSRSKKTNSSETKKRTTRKRKVKKTARKRKRRRRTERVQDEAAVNNDFVKRKLTERRPLGSASLERTLSFSLFGNKFDLDEFEEPEPEEKPKREELKRPDDGNPDILGRIFEGLGTLEPDNVSIQRDGSLVRKPRRRSMKVTSESDEEGVSMKGNDQSVSLKGKDQVMPLKGTGQAVKRKIEVASQSSSSTRIIDLTERSKVSTKDEPSALDVRPRRSFEIGCASRISSSSFSTSSSSLSSWEKTARVSYQPLPAAEKFKNIKIPKIKRNTKDDDTVSSNGVRRRHDKDENLTEKMASERRTVFKESSSDLQHSNSNRNEKSGSGDRSTFDVLTGKTSLHEDFAAPLAEKLPDYRIPKRPKINVASSTTKGTRCNVMKQRDFEAGVKRENNDKHFEKSDSDSIVITKRSSIKPTSLQKCLLSRLQNSESLSTTKQTDFRIPKLPKAASEVSLTKCKERDYEPPVSIKSEPIDIIGKILNRDDSSSMDNCENVTGPVASSYISESYSGQQTVREGAKIAERNKDAEQSIKTEVPIATGSAMNLIDVPESEALGSAASKRGRELSPCSSLSSKISRGIKVEKTETSPKRDNQRNAAEHDALEYEALGNATSERDQQFSSLSSTLSNASRGIKSEKIETSPKYHKQRNIEIDTLKNEAKAKATSDRGQQFSPSSSTSSEASREIKSQKIESSAKIHRKQNTQIVIPLSLNSKMSSFGRPVVYSPGIPIAKVSPTLRDASSLNMDELTATKENNELGEKAEESNIVARLQRTFVAEHECKKALKPYFKLGTINKDEYKMIMKKAVEKIKKSDRRITSEKVEDLIGKYVDFFRNKSSNTQAGTVTKSK